VEAIKFLWKHFEEAGCGSKLGSITLYGAGSGGKKYSTAATSLLANHSFMSYILIRFVSNIAFLESVFHKNKIMKIPSMEL